MMTSLDFVITYQVLIPELDIFSPLMLEGAYTCICDLTLGGHERGRHADQAGSTASYDPVSDPNTQKWLPVPPYS